MRSDNLNDRPPCDKCPRDADTTVRYAGAEYHLCRTHYRMLKQRR